jgi:hypothetical protein
MIDLDYLRRRVEKSRKSQHGPPELQTDLTDDLEEAVEEIDRLRAEIAELKTPNWYWDDNNLDEAIHPGDIGMYDDPGDIIQLQPIHELPKVWVLIRWSDEDGSSLEFYQSYEAAEAAKEE